MQNLLILLACIFAGVALLVVVTRSFGAATDEKSSSRVRRWIYPLVGLLLVLSALDYFLRGG